MSMDANELAVALLDEDITSSAFGIDVKVAIKVNGKEYLLDIEELENEGTYMKLVTDYEIDTKGEENAEYLNNIFDELNKFN